MEKIQEVTLVRNDNLLSYLNMFLIIKYNGFISTIFLDSIYIYIYIHLYMIFVFSLSDFTLYDRQAVGSSGDQREVKEGGYLCLLMTDSHCSMAETNTIL